ncbi:hypothetical protein B0J14DRAFT_127083 [Halenospora varia]|nr:hypothetical protein B0J14DRAFT_127083 [Halenospora varia]
MREGLFHLAFLLSVFVAAADSKTCYAPDGKTTPPAGNYMYMPCIAIDGVDSMCCALNRTENWVDVCQPNGLCLNSADNLYYRDYCTDKTWNSPNCLSKTVCANPNDNTYNNTQALTRCNDGSWCCGRQNNTDCCFKNLGFQLKANLVSFGNETSAAGGNSSSNCTIPTNTSLPSNSSNTTKVGVGVGVSLGLIAIVGTIAGFWFGQKRGQRMGSGMMGAPDQGINMWSGSGKRQYQTLGEVVDPIGAHEIGSSSTRAAELDTHMRR